MHSLLKVHVHSPLGKPAVDKIEHIDSTETGVNRVLIAAAAP